MRPPLLHPDDDHDHGPGGHTHGPGGHTHGPGGHDHGPGGHSHGPDDHDHGPGKPAAAPAAAETAEEAGSRALTEALGSSFVLVKGLMGILIVVFFLSGMFTVESNESAVVLQFGKPKGGADPEIFGPGWHWAWPYPIDEVVKVPMRFTHTVRSSVGWFNISPADEAAGKEPPALGSLNPAVEGYVLTSDGNIIHARATVRYLINKPVAYAFEFTGTSNLVQGALNNAITYAAARYDVDQATRLELIGFKDTVLTRCIELVRAQGLGIEIDRGNSNVETRPPRQVRDSFNAVLEAEADRGKMINEAQGKANEILGKAKGEAAAILSGAKADSTRIVQSARADADSFTSQLPRYQASSAFFEERRLVETLARVLPTVQEKYFLPDNAGKNREIRLQLNREPVKVGQPAATQP